MKRIVYLFILSLLTFQLYGKEIQVDKAKEVALKFLQQNSNTNFKSVALYDLKYLGDITSVNHMVSSSLKSATLESPQLYFFGITDSAGFIIVSADDVAIPVLGYSYDAKICKTNLPTNFQKWIEGYKQQINFLRSNKIKQTKEIAEQWNGDNSMLKSVNKSVNPLVTTQWNQAPYVNDKCPYDYGYGERAVTGCPATAMAQIMRYWKYPSKGVGFHSYQHDKYGTLSANFGSTTYNWDAMPNLINSTNDAVALLMYHCGVAVEMSYNVAEEGGSASYVIIDPGNYYPETKTVQYALKTYFGYDASLQGLQRENYSDNDWKNILKSELDAGRPIQYAGFGQGGHTFVCDGYDQNSYFHMNWGWGGLYDAFFLLDALNPGEGGIGAGDNSYNDYQQALIGIKPASSSTPDNPVQTEELQLFADVTVSSSSLSYGSSFTVHTNMLNGGTSTFNGDYCAAVFDKNDAFIDFVEIIPNVSLESNYYYTNGIDFTSNGLLTMLPGSYNIYIFARPTDGEWVCLTGAENSYINNYCGIDVTFENDIRLYSKMNVLTEQIYTGGALSVDVNIANYSDNDFTGRFDLSLYDLNGEYVATVEEKTNMSLYSYYYDEYTFTTNSLNVEPGTYLLALSHMWDGSDYELSGSTSEFINPIKLIVKGQPVYKDIYENNDLVEDAYDLDLSFSNNETEVRTTGSTIHVGNDWDFYSVTLDPNYYYSVNARLNDAYNSGDGNSYSVDCLFLYSTDGENWSDVYDDVMPDQLYVTGSRKLYFVISPYFLGETGTYLFDINLQRSKTPLSNKLLEKNAFSVSPNPCFDKVTISSDEEMQKYNLYDISGRLLKSEGIVGKKHVLDISAINKGTYILRIESANKTHTEKLLKQ
jgi:hypothetical protein